jgi:hypothetical protein
MSTETVNRNNTEVQSQEVRMDAMTTQAQMAKGGDFTLFVAAVL